jgi:hypothetical protein
MTRTAKIKFVTYTLLIGIMALLAGLFYLTTYYEADAEVLAALQTLPETIIYEQGDFWHGFVPASGTAARALLFYPEQKVQAISYLPTILPLVLSGYPVFILEYPFYIPQLSQRRARSAFSAHPEYLSWTLVGHSRGGSAAGRMAKAPPEDIRIDSLIYLAVSPRQSPDLSAASIRVMTITPDSDGLMSEARLDSAVRLPSGTLFRSIIGANSAQFGSYGDVAADAPSGISRSGQQEQTARLILGFLEDL